MITLHISLDLSPYFHLGIGQVVRQCFQKLIDFRTILQFKMIFSTVFTRFHTPQGEDEYQKLLINESFSGTDKCIFILRKMHSSDRLTVREKPIFLCETGGKDV